MHVIYIFSYLVMNVQEFVITVAIFSVLYFLSSTQHTVDIIYFYLVLCDLDIYVCHMLNVE